MAPTPSELIAKKRDGKELEPEEIDALIRLFMDGSLADYQMSAWLMAAYLRGLSDGEMLALTRAMLHSGTELRHPGLDGPIVDKHSTGGVGDKLSLPLAPLVAACGAYVPMISGRGLGHTGGTLDKLESIPGYDVRLSPAKFRAVVKKAGASIIGQTPDIAPADKRIYALRDVTGTVACRPLIVASILSKKLAAGLDALVLDVKVGRGAFMKTRPTARALAKSLVGVATELGTSAVACLTAMDAPLGTTIGNALEVRESIEILRGEGPADTTELTLLLGEEMLVQAGLASTRKEARVELERALQSGKALARFAKMIELHGGDPRIVDQPKRLPQAPKRIAVVATSSGFVTAIDSLGLADVALHLGAGRLRAEDTIDHAVGIELAVRIGDRVERGQPLATLHVRKGAAAVLEKTRAAFALGARRPPPEKLVLGRVRAPE